MLHGFHCLTERIRGAYTPEHDGEEIQKTKKTKAARLNSRTQNGDGIHPLLPFVSFTQAVVQGKHSHLRRTRERVMLVIKKRRDGTNKQIKIKILYRIKSTPTDRSCDNISSR